MAGLAGAFWSGIGGYPSRNAPAKRLQVQLDRVAVRLRADRLVPLGARLSYVQCPQSPFLNSNEQFVCEGK